ncbi:MAG: flagellin lysine-N-methylase [Gammaproteobacteria bacterium]|nr:flagellin lysine-N-methylase [Gammaproteobacteria bacterium]
MSESLACVGPRYMLEFQCIGAACEDTCCRGWIISIDQKTHKRMKKAMDGSKAARARFREAIQRNRDPQAKAAEYAFLKLNAAGRCHFLREDGLCGVHAEHGESLLSLTCKTYPRRLTRFGNRVEMSASLSCPEAARRCLLSPGANELVSLESLLVAGREMVFANHIPNPNASTATRYRDVVRELSLALLDSAGFPLESRLFFVCFLAHRMAALGDAPGDAQRVIEIVELLSGRESLQTLHEQFQAISPSVELPLSIVQTLLLNREAERELWVADVIVEVWRSLGGSDEPSARLRVSQDQGTISVDGSSLLKAYLQRKNRATERFGEQLELILGNYCKNYWIGEGPETAPDPLSHFRRLSVRLGVLKFLLLGHPRMLELLESDASPDSLSTALSEHAVRIVTRFCRSIEHNEGFLEHIEQNLIEQGFTDMAHLSLMLKL